MEDEDIFDLYDDSDPKASSPGGDCNPMDIDRQKNVSEGGRYLCWQCRRSATDEKTLCFPVSL